MDDLDGTVLEERIYHMAGSDVPQALSEKTLHELIRAAGRVPAERDSLYNVLKVHDLVTPLSPRPPSPEGADGGQGEGGRACTAGGRHA